MATRIAVMSAGRVVQSGTPRDIYYHPVDRFVADFIGESNFLEGVAVRDGARSYVRLGGGSTVDAPADAPPGSVTLMVRPESVSVGPPPAANGEASLSGRVIHVAFIGNHTRVTVRTPAGDVVALRPHSEGSASSALDELLDQEVCAWWSPQDSTIVAHGSTEKIDERLA